MAQLSDDCFAFGGPMRSVEDTVALLIDRLSPVEEIETVGLAEADGRVLAANLSAPMPLPPFTNSAVDGYAIRGDDLPQGAPRAFAVTDRIQAGARGDRDVAPGRCARIFTGAPMPTGTDTVFMQEDVTIDENGAAVLPPGLRRGANVRPAGEDVALGAPVLAAGRRLRPQDVGLLAALGSAAVSVRRRLRVAVLSTGNEIVEPGQARGPAQLNDSNRFMLAAMLRRLGCTVTDVGILRDDAGTIERALVEAAGHDLILTSGGVSTGEADFVRTAVERVGTLVFWRVAIKPGRPVAMGVIGGTPFIGLPGNPVASFVTFATIARPAILALSGAQQESVPAMPVRAAFSYRKKSGRREFVRVFLRPRPEGLEAEKFPREGAGLLCSLIETDGLVELPEDSAGVSPGDIVAFRSFDSLF